MWPSDTAGTGSIRPQYLKEHDGQGGGLTLRRVSCANCGLPGADLVRHDHSGGSLDGSGAGGVVALQAITSGHGSSTQNTGDGDQQYRTGGGCPLCFSKNFGSRGRRHDEFLAQGPDEDRLVCPLSAPN